MVEVDSAPLFSGLSPYGSWEEGAEKADIVTSTPTLSTGIVTPAS
jgi:hypothetical protein